MTDFNSYKTRQNNSWTDNETATTEEPKAANIWLKFNSFLQNLTDNFDSLVRALISVSGNGSYNSSTGEITVNSGGREIDNFSFNGSREFIATYSDTTTDNLGIIDGKSIKAIDSALNGSNTDITFYEDTGKTQIIGTISIPNGVDGSNGANGSDGADGADGATGSVSAASSLNLNQQASLPNGSSGDAILVALDDDTVHLVFPDDSSIKLIGSTVKNAYSKAQYVIPESVTYAANITLDLNNSNSFEIGLLTGNLTLDNPTNLNDGQDFSIRLTGDATGGHTVNFGTAFKFITSFDVGANEEYLISCHVRGSNIYAAKLGGAV